MIIRSNSITVDHNYVDLTSAGPSDSAAPSTATATAAPAAAAAAATGDAGASCSPKAKYTTLESVGLGFSAKSSRSNRCV
jgi:hypothetical protein